MLDLKRLLVFREVVRQGSLSSAAIAMNYSQPAVSHHIGRLELELGAQLLIRSRTGAVPTTAGRALLEHVDALLEQAAEAEAHVIAVAAAALEPVVRIAAFATASATIVADAVACLRKDGLTAEVRLVEGDPGDAVAALRMHQVDVAIAFDDEQHPLAFPPDILGDRLLDDPMLVALRRDHALATSAQVELPSLRQAEWIQGAGEETPASLILMAACEAAGFQPRVTFSTGNFWVVQELVASGIGVALVPALALSRPHPDVVARRLTPTAAARRIWLLHRGDEKPAHVVLLLEALRAAAHQRQQQVLSIAA